MNADEKSQRRDRIADAVAARSAKTPTFRTYWLTRNRLLGELSGKVDIWLAKPDRIVVDGDVQWIAFELVALKTADAPEESAHYGRWTIAQATVEVGAGVPANDRECLRVGHDVDESRLS